eukprot:1843641-Alexandrium_andersonii.AAC.1
MLHGAQCLGAALWAFGRALSLLALAGCLTVATRVSVADGGLKIHTWCASLAPELLKEVRSMQLDCQTYRSILGVRLCAGGLAA